MTKRVTTLPFLAVVALVALACSNAAAIPQPEPTPTPSNTPTSVVITADNVFDFIDPPDKNHAFFVEPEPQFREVPPPVDGVPGLLLRSGWKTDFSKHSVPFAEIRSGGPGRDGIPPIDDPKFISVSNPPSYMKGSAPVISVEIAGEAKAYPLAILISHEIVNDSVGGVPITVTYCPLCNSAIAFDRRVDGRLLDFGTSGNLRNSDLIMWDRQTESWWQQITGEAIVGELTGAKLTFIPSPVISWSQFVEAFPDGRVLSRDTGFKENYDFAPYVAYDEIGRHPFLFRGEVDSQLPATERVVSWTVNDNSIAFPFMALEENPVVNGSFEGQDFVIFYAGVTLSPFAGAGFGPSRVVGSTGVFSPMLEGRKLTFTADGDVIADEHTGSKWTILGEAVEGPLIGSKLTPIIHGNHFWFAWAAFNPDTVLRMAEDILN